MAVVTAPGRRLGRTARSRVAGQLRWLRAMAGRLARPARAPLANLASMPMHVAALGCLDAAPFQRSWHVALGLVVICGSLIYLELAIADEP